MIAPTALVAHVLAEMAVTALFALCIFTAVFCLTMAGLVEMRDRQDRKRERERMQVPEVPPAPEAPHVPAPARDQLARAEVLRVAYVARRQTKVQKEIDRLIQEVSRG